MIRRNKQNPKTRSSLTSTTVRRGFDFCNIDQAEILCRLTSGYSTTLVTIFGYTLVVEICLPEYSPEVFFSYTTSNNKIMRIVMV